MRERINRNLGPIWTGVMKRKKESRMTSNCTFGYGGIGVLETFPERGTQGETGGRWPVQAGTLLS